MSKCLTLFTILIVSLKLASCGVKKNIQNNSYDSRLFVEAQLLSKECGGKSVEMIEELLTKLEDDFIGLSPVEERANPEIRELTKSSIQKLNLSISFFINEIKKLQLKIEKLQINNTSLSEFLELEDGVRKVRAKFNRWADRQCHLTMFVDNQSQKINDLIEFENTYCEDSCSPIVPKKNQVTKEDFKKKIVSICSLLDTKGSCYIQYELALVYNYQKQFIEKILNKAKKHFQKELYGLSETPLEIQCQKSDKYILTIPIYENEQSASLKKAILKYWGGRNIEINFTESPYGARLVRSDNGLSKVYNNNLSVIYLSQDTPDAERIKTIAHEFGHSLGFRDCYIEFFDLNKQELVYYELDQDESNLMCSLKTGVTVPEKYLERLISKYCY